MKGKPHRPSDLSPEALQARSGMTYWKGWKEKTSIWEFFTQQDCHSELKKQINSVPDKQRPMEYITTTLVLQDMLKAFLWTEKKWH